VKYTSTRGHAQLCSAAEAIRTGIAADGGLFVPIALPGLDLSSLCAKQGYVEIATAVLGALLTDYNGKNCVNALRRLMPISSTTRRWRRWSG
jgi:threonine synthase